MQQVKNTDRDIYAEFLHGNWVVNKNPDVPFCCIGTDHALEHANRMMKVSGGIVGITLNATARNRFFLTAPYMALFTEQAERMPGGKTYPKKVHHEASNTFLQNRKNNIFLLTETLESYGNPFEDDGETLVNFVTKKVVSPQVQHDLMNCSFIGKERHTTFVDDRISSNSVNFWSRLPKTKLKMWKSGNLTKKFTVTDAKVIELTEDRALLGRMAIISKSRPELDMKEMVGQYEFSVVPRALFAPDGSMLYCSNKSMLYHCVVDELLLADSVTPNNIVTEQSVIIIDAMAEKDDTVETSNQIADVFIILWDRVSVMLFQDSMLFQAQILLVLFVEKGKKRGGKH